MFAAIRLHFARRAFQRAVSDYAAYQAMPAGKGWSHRVALALLIRQDRATERYAAAIGPGAGFSRA